jgi:hypothetical protein
VSNGFYIMLIVVDYLTRMVHLLQCTKSVTAEETASLFCKVSKDYTDYLECLTDMATRNSSHALDIHIGDA